MNSHGTWLRELYSYRIGESAPFLGSTHNKCSFLVTIFPFRVVVPSARAHPLRCTQWVIDIGFDPVGWTG